MAANTPIPTAVTEGDKIDESKFDGALVQEGEEFFSEVLQDEEGDFSNEPPVDTEPLVAPSPVEPVAPVEPGTILPTPTVAAPVQPEPPPTPGVVPEGGPVPEVPPTPATPPEPVAAPPVAPAAAPAAPVVPAAPVPTREERTTALKVKRDKVIESISGQYTLSDEDAEAFVTNPETVLPKMIGRLYVDIYDAITASLAQNMPGAVNTVMNHRQAQTEGEQAFFKAWPKLGESDEYRAVVAPIAAAYSQANPDSSRDEFIQNVGAMTMWKLGLVEAGQPAQPAPATPPVAVPVPSPNPQRFSPAAPGASAPPPPATAKGTWSDLAEEFQRLE